jgi:prepilin peptidase CpaA
MGEVLERLGPDIWAYALLAAVLIAAAVTDVRAGKIYNWITLPAMLAGLAGHAIIGGLGFGEGGRLGLADAVLGLAVGFAPMLVAWLAGGIGGGDVKLMGAVGALAGWRFVIPAMFFGFAAAAVMAVGILVFRRQLIATLKRIGRFAMLALVKAGPGDPSTPQSPKLPFGLAMCIGTFIALGLTVALGPGQTWFLWGM